MAGRCRSGWQHFSVSRRLWRAPRLAAQPTAGAPASPVVAEATAPKIHELLTLLTDPGVQAWLKQQNETKSAAASRQDMTEESVSQALDTRLAAIREHIVALASTVPDLPNQFWQGHARVTADLGENGRVKALLLLAVFVGLGAGAEWLFRRATQRVRRHLDTLPSETVKDRLHLVALRFAFAVGLVAAFALGSICPFLALDWPPLLRQMLFGLLVAFLVVRIANAVGHFLLAPHHERFRIIPMDTMGARFWHRRLVAFVGWFAFGWVIVGFGVPLGYTLEARQFVAYALGLGLLAIALEAVWRRPAALAETRRSAVTGNTPFRAGRGQHGDDGRHRGVMGVLGSPCDGGLLAHSGLITLPLAIRVTRRAVENLLRPPGSPQVADGRTERACRMHRARRSGAPDHRWQLRCWPGAGASISSHLRGQDTWVARLADGALSAVVILLIADFLWQADEDGD